MWLAAVEFSRSCVMTCRGTNALLGQSLDRNQWPEDGMPALAAMASLSLSVPRNCHSATALEVIH